MRGFARSMASVCRLVRMATPTTSAKPQSPVPVRQAGQSRPTNKANKDKYVASFANEVG